METRRILPCSIGSQVVAAGKSWLADKFELQAGMPVVPRKSLLWISAGGLLLKVEAQREVGPQRDTRTHALLRSGLILPFSADAGCEPVRAPVRQPPASANARPMLKYHDSAASARASSRTNLVHGANVLQTLRVR